MNTRKNLSALGAALLMMVISGPASAFECAGNDNTFDQNTISENLIKLATELRCKSDTTTDAVGWQSDNPIWEKRHAPSCDVHSRLAKTLYEAREFSSTTKPRKNKNNDAMGAAWDVRNGYYQSALDKLASFMKDAYGAKLNREFDPSINEAKYHRMHFRNEAEAASVCIGQLLLLS